MTTWRRNSNEGFKEKINNESTFSNIVTENFDNTEPTVGASTWASGNQICKGNIGIFEAKDKKNPNHKNVSFSKG